MAVRIKFDSSHNIIEPTFVLSTRTGDKLGPIPAVEISVSDDFNDAFKLEFKVYKYNNGVKCELWERITDFALVWCREWDVWFEISVTLNDNNATVKSISGVSLGEAELSQIILYEFEANTEDDIARDDYKPTVLYDEDDAEASLLDRMMEKVPHYTIAHVDTHIQSLQRTFTFDNTSILDAFNDIAEEIDCIFVIDSGTNDDGEIARAIYVYDLQSYCIDCTHRDSFQGACPECGGLNIIRGYGDDTSIFVSTENLAEDIQLEVDTGSVKNCFRLEAGDDLMTAAIRSCNPNGSQYIWYVSDDVRADMPSTLVEKLEDYDKLYNFYVADEAKYLAVGTPVASDLSKYYEKSGTTYTQTSDTSINSSKTYYIKNSIVLDSAAVANYNTLINKYVTYKSTLATITNPVFGYSNLMNIYYDVIDFRLFLSDEFMPTVSTASTTAAAQAALITSATMSPVAVQNLTSSTSVSTCSSAALAMAKTLVRPTYQVKVNSGATFTNNVWSGSFKITNYSDETDTANSSTIFITINDDYEDFVLQRIQKLLSQQDENYDPTTVSEVFKLSYSNFVNKLKEYGLSTLRIFYDCGQSVLDVLLQLGVANDSTWADQNPDLYTEIYLPYYNKLLAVDAEMSVRETEIDTIDALKKDVEDNRTEIQYILNFQEYLGTNLWLDFSAYRREDLYSNSNFVSDGLTNAEIFELAREFINDAKKDIYKSATLQHSISATLKNLLMMKEFAPIIDYFKVGNWIRVRADDVIYRLRLLSYSIEFDNPDDISIEFSDVQRCMNGLDDTLSVLDSASSMASSYDFVSRQAKKGYNGNEKLAHWVEDGLAMTKMKIIDNADYQNMQWDEHGMLLREYLPLTDEYSDKQLKIINRGLYVTDDNWKTSRAGIGDFVYYDPGANNGAGGNVESYGVIADTIVGKIILGEEVGIYNTEGSVTIDDNGMKICADLTYDDTTDTMFRIQRKVTDNTSELGYKIEDLLYLDTDGDLVINGTMSVYTGGANNKQLSDFLTGSDIAGQIEDPNSTIGSSIDDKLNAANDLLEGRVNQSIISVTSSRNYVLDSDDVKTATISFLSYNLSEAFQDIVSNKYVYVSFDAKTSNGTDTFDVYFRSSTNNTSYTSSGGTITNATTTYQRFSLNMIVPSDNCDIIRFRNNVSQSQTNSGTLYIKNVKVEYSTRATNWSMAPEDTAVYSDNLLADLQSQVDGKIQTYNQTTDPSLEWNNYQKSYHFGDLWYNSTTKETYRWDGNEWDKILNDEAQSAAYLASQKAQVFIIQPVPPYKPGDLWITSTTSQQIGVVKTCIQSRSDGDVFNSSDWVEGLKYTDDTAVDELSIGGRNLLLNTSSPYILSGSSYDDYLEYGAGYVECIATGGKNAYVWIHNKKSNLFDITAEKTYTFSADVKVSGSTYGKISLSFRVGATSSGANVFSSQNINNDNKWHRISFTFTNIERATNDHLLLVVGFTSNATVGDRIDFGNIKLEDGDKATAWTPAPEDTDKFIDETATRLQEVIDEERVRSIDAEEKIYHEIDNVKKNLVTTTDISKAISDSQAALESYTKDMLDDAFAPINTWTAVVNGGFIIGDMSNNGEISDFYTKITNSELGFWHKDEKVAYVSNQHLYINNATIKQRMVVGKFFVNRNDNGGMTITWDSYIE